MSFLFLGWWPSVRTLQTPLRLLLLLRQLLDSGRPIGCAATVLALRVAVLGSGRIQANLRLGSSSSFFIES